MNKIVSGFPGTGKSYLTENYEGSGLVLDSDSSTYSWLGTGADKVRNPDFPNNYMRHIANNIGSTSLILVSTHEDVRTALVDHGIRFTIAYPQRELKEEYLQRYKDRNSPDGFISLMDANWHTFLQQLEGQAGADHVILGQGQFLSDVVDLGLQR